MQSAPIRIRIAMASKEGYIMIKIQEKSINIPIILFSQAYYIILAVDDMEQAAAGGESKSNQ